MATFLIELSPQDMQRRLHDALTVYVDAMRYPRGTEGQRASMWLEHTRRRGWKAVAAVEAANPADAAVEAASSADAAVEVVEPASAAAAVAAPTDAQLGAAPLLGVAYGYSGAPDQWWQQQVTQGEEEVR